MVKGPPEQQPLFGKATVDLNLQILTPAQQEEEGAEQQEEQAQQEWLAGAAELAAAVGQSSYPDVEVQSCGDREGVEVPLSKALQALLTPQVVQKLTYLLLHPLVMDSLDHLASCPLPVLEQLDIRVSDMGLSHLALIAGLPAPRLRHICVACAMGANGANGAESSEAAGLTAVCMRPQPVNAAGRPVCLRVEYRINNAASRVQEVLRVARMSGRVKLVTDGVRL